MTHTGLLTKDSASIKLGVDSCTTPISNGQTNNILWGVAAAAMIGWATSTALEERERRKEAEEQQRRQAEAEAARLNAAEAARKAQEWQAGQNMLNALIEDAQAQGAGLEEIAKLKETAATQGLGVAIPNAANLVQQMAARAGTHPAQQRQAARGLQHAPERIGERERGIQALRLREQTRLRALDQQRRPGRADLPAQQTVIPNHRDPKGTRPLGSFLFKPVNQTGRPFFEACFEAWVGLQFILEILRNCLLKKLLISCKMSENISSALLIYFPDNKLYSS